MVLINRDLLEPAPDQGFVKFRQVGRLAANEILKRCDALDLFVSCYRVNGGLLFQFPEPENLIGNLIVSFLAVGLLKKLLLKLQYCAAKRTSFCKVHPALERPTPPNGWRTL